MSGRNIFFTLAGVIVALAVLLSSRTNSDLDSEPRQWPGRNNTVLFISDSHHGLANVLLATSHAILINHPDIDLHYASFESTSKKANSISQRALKSSDAQPIKFHTIEGTSFGQAMAVDDLSEVITSPGYNGVLKFGKDLQWYIMPWSAPQYLENYHEVLRIIDEVDPVVVIVDPMVPFASDATRVKGRKEVVLSPNSLLDSFVTIQPWASALWKYPIIGSGYPFPVPWHLIPANVYMGLSLAFLTYFTPMLQEKKEYLKAHGLADPLNVFSLWTKDVVWITQASLEADFPLSVLPDNIVQCGPIYLSTAPAAEQDADLTAWLKRAPTVLVNLGSAMNYDQDMATVMASAIKKVLETTDLQFLWKFNKRHSYSDEFLSDLSGEIESGRLKLENWLDIDPAAILETGAVVASVHHGGANCFHEAIGNGIPHIVLPMWADTYDYANRVEYLGTGVWGSKSSAPNWTTEELSNAFFRVLGDHKEGKSIRTKAKELGKKYQQYPGRFRAADEIAKLVRNRGAFEKSESLNS